MGINFLNWEGSPSNTVMWWVRRKKNCMMVILNAVLGYDGEPLATYVAREKN
jgi:hypothetical protein